MSLSITHVCCLYSSYTSVRYTQCTYLEYCAVHSIIIILHNARNTTSRTRYHCVSYHVYVILCWLCNRKNTSITVLEYVP